MWRYSITSGALTDPDGKVVGHGHSGFGDAMNDPTRVREKNVGPLPPGRYRIGDAFEHPSCGPVSMRLVPCHGVEQFGRSGFLIHGANRTPDPTDDSHGCIVADRSVRLLVATSLDRDLEVTDV